MSAERFEAPEVGQAFLLWQRELHPFTCGGGGGPCSGVELELIAANPHAFLLGCPECGRQQLEHRGGGYFDGVMRYAAQHDPATCYPCRFAALDLHDPILYRAAAPTPERDQT